MGAPPRQAEGRWVEGTVNSLSLDDHGDAVVTRTGSLTRNSICDNTKNHKLRAIGARLVDVAKPGAYDPAL